ncbi:hypothetical protein K9M42_01485 [Patescibacteria group bacterium]|nr:hypothetical protein [Patescibacteria group bacterium]
MFLDIFQNFNANLLVDLFNQPFYSLFWYTFSRGLWIYVAILIMKAIFDIRLNNARGKWYGGMKRVCLAIDMPKDNEQTPKATEAMFTHLTAIYAGYTTAEKFIEGRIPIMMAFEIVSLEGYIQFMINCPERNRDFIEATVFAQYPEAEITEIPDYVNNFPSEFPCEYEMYGTEFGYKNEPYYPIKTYQDFFDKDAMEELRFKDPMAAILESMSVMSKGEYQGLQIVLRNPGGGFEKKVISEGRDEINRLMGVKTISKDKKNPILIFFKDFFSTLFTSKLSTWGDQPAPEKNDLMAWESKLSISDKNKVQAIEKKLSKPMFQVKIRFFYMAKKEVMNKSKGISTFFGSTFQFVNTDGNALKSNGEVTTLDPEYFLKNSRRNYRKNQFMGAWKKRHLGLGGPPIIMNVEELATLFHFPSSQVKTPNLSKIDSKKIEPPTDLPVIDDF